MAKISISDLRPADVALEEAKVVGFLEPLTPTELTKVKGGGRWKIKIKRRKIKIKYYD